MRRLSAAGAVALGLCLAAPRSDAQVGRVRVYGVGVPGAATSRWGERDTVIFRVSVRNDSSVAVPYLIRVELEGVVTSSSSPINTVLPGEIARIPVTVDVDLRRIPSGGDAMRFSVILLNDRREEMNRFAGTLPVRPVASGPLSITPDLIPGGMRFSRDIALVRIIYADPRGPRGAGFLALVKNRGREAFAYTGSLASQIGMGTPESHIEWSDRLILAPASLPSGLAPGDSALIFLPLQPVSVRTSLGEMRMVPALPTELWITVRVFADSSYDVNPSNDALYYIIRLNSDRRVAESRSIPAPPLTVRVR